MKRKTKWAVAASLVFAIGGAAVFNHVGFIEITELAYAPFVRDIDGRSELAVTTFPAWFPRDVSRIPYINRKMETHDEVNFQVHVRDAGGQAGPNPHVKSIRIHSFSYQAGAGPRTELISGFDSHFWMQGNSNYDTRNLPPVPWDAKVPVQIEISLTLNGTSHSFQGEMKPVRKSRYAPLIMELYR